MDPEHVPAHFSGVAAAFLRDGYWIAYGPPDGSLISQLLAAAEQAASGAADAGERPGPNRVVDGPGSRGS